MNASEKDWACSWRRSSYLLNCFELQRGERLTNEWSCVPPAHADLDPLLTYMLSTQLPAHRILKSRSKRMWLLRQTLKRQKWSGLVSHTHACSALVSPYHPPPPNVISPAWLMFSCKNRGDKIPLWASTIQTGTSKGDEAALQLSHLFSWRLPSLEISQISHHPHRMQVTY